MNIYSYASKTIEEIEKEMEVDLKNGLSAEQAKKKNFQFGYNEISGAHASGWRIFWRQLKSPFIYLLIGAALLAWFLHERADAVIIFLFISINVFLGFYQEYRSEQTLKLLNQYVVPLVTVRRRGEDISLPARDLVPGDIIKLVTGDKIPADIRFTETINLKADESILTGESVPVEKNSQPKKTEVKTIYEAGNLGFSGTTIISGKATAIVLRTGKETEVGDIIRLATEARHVSSFEKGVSRFSQFIIRMTILTLVFVFLANIFLKRGEADFAELLIFSIALAVSVIPEALPLVMTFSLSRGALMLAKKKVVVKRLSAIEDLGSIDVLCTDKTGTLTENKLTIKDVYSSDPDKTLLYANYVSADYSRKKVQLEPFDIALWEGISPAVRKVVSAFEVIADIPFNPERRRNSVLVKKGKACKLIVRGAPEEIFSLCADLPKKEISAMQKWIAAEGCAGARVLAVAALSASACSGDRLESLEKDLEFLGIISFIDPIKITTFAAIEKAKALGVSIKVITGDSPEVAGAVAEKIKLISSQKQVISGLDFKKLSEAEQTKAVEKYNVFARITPDQKYKIIELLERKHEVGFLGEGINDTPALKIANVSLVVQSAAEAARENADIVLLSKNLEVIIDGIKDGREVFANTTKYIKITLASNFGNFYAVAVASLLIDFLPMLPIQLLLVNLLSDFPMIAIATDSVDRDEIASPRKYNIKDIVIIATILGVVSSIFDFIFFGLFYRISPEVLQTNWFIASILTELALIYSLRTHLPFFRAKFPSKLLFSLSILAATATVALPFIPFSRSLFRFIEPEPAHIALIIGIIFIYFFITEAVKLYYYRPGKQANN